MQEATMRGIAPRFILRLSLPGGFRKPGHDGPSSVVRLADVRKPTPVRPSALVFGLQVTVS